MLKHLYRLLICFISIQLCIGDVRASNIDDICSSTTPCETPVGKPYGLFCRTNDADSTKRCVACTIKPDDAMFTGDGGDSDNCPWECKNINDKCNGFHRVDNRCDANKQNCTDGFQVWDNSTANFSECYTTNCASGKTLITNGTFCDVSHGTLNSCIFAIHL